MGEIKKHSCYVNTRANHYDNKATAKPTEINDSIVNQDISSDELNHESFSVEPYIKMEKPETVEVNDIKKLEKILREYHNSPIGYHQGIERTYKRISLKFRWKNLFRDVEKFVKTCPKCQLNKSGPSNKAPMVITTTSRDVFEKLTMDIVGALPETCDGNKYILTMQDDLSRLSIAIPLHSFDAKTTARALVEHMICIYGVPKLILTDQGINFVSELFQEVCKLFKIKKNSDIRLSSIE